MGLSSAFLHLSRASVRAGDRVRQGQEIGRVGATGRATGPHLHWSLVWNGARLDPQAASRARDQRLADPPRPHPGLVVDPHHEAAQRGAVDHHRAGPAAAGAPADCCRPAPRPRRPAARPPIGRCRSGWPRRPRPRPCRPGPRPRLVAAAEDRDARQRQAEQPPPALAHLGAVDHDHVAPRRRRLERRGGGVETLQPRRGLGDRRGSAPAPRTAPPWAAARRAARAARPARRRAAGRREAKCVRVIASPIPRWPWRRINAGAAALWASLERDAAPWHRLCGKFAT